VTPSVFDCAVDLDSDAWEAERVFGSPGFEIPQKGRLMFLDSSFPSPKEGANMTKGGVVLVKLKPKKPGQGNAKIQFKLSYTDRFGTKYNETEVFEIPSSASSSSSSSSSSSTEDYFQDSSIRKAILLTRFVTFMKHYLRDAANGKTEPIMKQQGLKPFTPPIPGATPTHSESPGAMRALKDPYREVFTTFIAHFKKESAAVKDEALDRELQQLLTIYDFKEEEPKAQQEQQSGFEGGGFMM